MHRPHPPTLPKHADQEEGPIATTCFMLGAEPITSLVGSELHTRGAALIFLNGNLLGVHRRPHKLVQAIRWGAVGAGADCVAWRALAGRAQVATQARAGHQVRI